MVVFVICLNHYTSGPILGSEDMKIDNEHSFVWENKQGDRIAMEGVPVMEECMWWCRNTGVILIADSNWQITTRKIVSGPESTNFHHAYPLIQVSGVRHEGPGMFLDLTISFIPHL